MEASSRMSPVTGSQSMPAMLLRNALARISTLTRKPRATKARATAEPTNPEAPVTNAMSDIGRSDIGESAPAFDRLPVNQGRHTQHDLARPLEQGHRHAHFHRQAEQRRQHGIAPFLHPDGGRHRRGDA